MTRRYSQSEMTKDQGEKTGTNWLDDQNKEVRCRIVYNIYPEGICDKRILNFSSYKETDYLFNIFTNPSARQDMTQGQFLSGV